MCTSKEQTGPKSDIPISQFGELLEILWSKTVGCSSDIQFEHPSSSVGIGKWDINTFLESVISTGSERHLDTGRTVA
jgi:hypothetical protein